METIASKGQAVATTLEAQVVLSNRLIKEERLRIKIINLTKTITMKMMITNITLNTTTTKKKAILMLKVLSGRREKMWRKSLESTRRVLSISFTDIRPRSSPLLLPLP
jgi:hypothetical protein